MLSFGAFPAEVPARVRFLHPLHNFTIVSYDPRQLSEEVGPWLLEPWDCGAGCKRLVHTVHAATCDRSTVAAYSGLPLSC